MVFLRGVRQGDPLSPHLFVLEADFLHTTVNSSKSNGFLHLPIPLPCDPDFPILQYADDTLIFDVVQLNHLKSLLHSFADSSDLRVDFDKSLMLPINVSKDKLELLANALSCLKGSLPFTYLDLLLSTTKPSVADFWSLVSKCERRLTTFSSFFI